MTLVALVVFLILLVTDGVQTPYNIATAYEQNRAILWLHARAGLAGTIMWFALWAILACVTAWLAPEGFALLALSVGVGVELGYVLDNYRYRHGRTLL